MTGHNDIDDDSATKHGDSHMSDTTLCGVRLVEAFRSRERVEGHFSVRSWFGGC